VLDAPNSSESDDTQLTDGLHDALIAKLGSGKRRKYTRFAFAALSSIPWVGGLIAASASLSAERDQEKVGELQRLWLEEHAHKIEQLNSTLADIFARLDNFGDEVQARIESPEYLGLVKKTFRAWDEADTDEKKEMFKKLITNAGAIALCPDDLVRLFILWIEQYHESHFLVIKEIYRHPRITRGQIWDRIRGKRPREDSSEADLFRYLVRELSTGGVIRQERETDAYGRFLKKEHKSEPDRTHVMESAFEDTKPYVLTELGKQFVHYVMENVTPQLGGARPGDVAL
jgi:hypothetical protein